MLNIKGNIKKSLKQDSWPYLEEINALMKKTYKDKPLFSERKYVTREGILAYRLGDGSLLISLL